MNVTHPEESRVGIVSDGVLEFFEIESCARERLKGNIYKGVVHRIHPALEAAFVNIGGERDAFLPLDEICFRNLPGNGRLQAKRPRIRSILKPGQEILVQIVKDEFASKPPTLGTFFSLPGRYLVLLPGSDDAGISRKIEGDDRARLRALVEKLKPPAGFGLIVRTAAGFDQDRGELERDLVYLRRLWDSILESAECKRGPALVYREHDLVMRNIRDYFTPDIDEIYVDNEEVYQRAREFLRAVMPGKEHVLRLYSGDQPIFSRFNVEGEIESVFKRRVGLKSGGSIIIDGTEALTAIDVNSGGSVRGGSQEETAYHTNLEAGAEIARQLRLRDVGGLIVIDFIDMRQAGHNRDVENTIAEAMKPDRARHEIGRISRFGLLEISRQRLRPAAATASYTSCPMCEGHGLVRTTESAALVALRKIHKRIAPGDVGSLRARLPGDVGVYLLNQKREDLATLERRYGARIHVSLSEALMPHQVELEVEKTRKVLRPSAAGPGPGEVAAPTAAAGTVAPAALAGTNGEESAAPAAGKKRRRRGRRRGRSRGKLAAGAIAEALSSLAARAGVSPAAREEEPVAGEDLGVSTATAAPALEAPRGRGQRAGASRRRGGARTTVRAAGGTSGRKSAVKKPAADAVVSPVETAAADAEKDGTPRRERGRQPRRRRSPARAKTASGRRKSKAAASGSE